MVARADSDGAVSGRVDTLCRCAPQAIGQVKRLVREVTSLPAGRVTRFTAEVIAELRVSDEAREGMTAFLEKRRPKWAPNQD